jgi:hypothetical protein
VGSYSHGTYIEGVSDIDYKGVYMQSNEDILTFGYKEQIDINANETYYEIKRFLELLQKNDGNALAMLYSPEDLILYKHPSFDILIERKSDFLTKQCLKSFGDYAVGQIKRAKGLDKKMNWEKERVERKTPLDFVYLFNSGVSIKFQNYLDNHQFKQEYCGLTKVDHMKDIYSLYYDFDSFIKGNPSKFRGISLDTSNSIRLTGVPKNATCIGVVSFNKDEYSKHCRDYNNYQDWLSKRNTQRYVDTEEHGQKIDGKNMLHCRRLLDIAKEIATEKTLNVRRPNSEYLINIRLGKVDLNTIIANAEKDIIELPELYENSGLPESVSDDLIRDILLKMRKF